MKVIICLLIVASSVFGFVNLNAPKIKSSDFKRLIGEQWKGKLTYQDYRSNKKVSILWNLIRKLFIFSSFQFNLNFRCL